MKLLEKIRQWNKSNAGLTLVEIIVTMLILVIIALPILGGFIVAGRANAKAKEMAYARSAAENVVEVLNRGGVSAELFQSVAWSCTPSPIPVPDPEATITPSPEDVYIVTGIKAGTGTYTAEVICNRIVFKDANEYQLPDMNTLDAEETAVIFPESNFYKFKDGEDGEKVVDTEADIHRFDSTAVSDFYQTYHDGVLEIYGYIVEAYLKELANIEKANAEIEKTNESEGKNPPDPTLALPQEPPYPGIREKDESITVSGEELPLKAFLHRTMDITVEYGKDTETDTVQATIFTKYIYEMRSEFAGTLEDMVELSFKDFFEEGSSSVLKTEYSYINTHYTTGLEQGMKDLVRDLREAKDYTVAAETTVPVLNNLYLIVNCFNADIVGNVKNYNTLALTVKRSTLEVGADYLVKNPIDVFFVVQDEDGVTLQSSDSVNLVLTDTVGLTAPFFMLHSEMDLKSVDALATGQLQTELFMNRDKAEGNVLYAVTVKIYNPDDLTKELTKIETTISSRE